MARGHPDYGAAAATTYVATVTDLGELAARLNSAVVQYRTGNVLFVESFEDGIAKWKLTNVGTGAVYAKDLTQALHGAASLKMTPPPLAGSQARISRNTSSPPNNRMGLEASMADVYNATAVDLGLDLTGALVNLVAEVSINPVSGVLSYLDDTFSFVPFATHPGGIKGGGLWHTLKLVADFDLREYVRLHVDNQTYSMAGLGIYVDTAIANFFVQQRVSLLDATTLQNPGYFDSIIFTINEP